VSVQLGSVVVNNGRLVIADIVSHPVIVAYCLECDVEPVVSAEFSDCLRFAMEHGLFNDCAAGGPGVGGSAPGSLAT